MEAENAGYKNDYLSSGKKSKTKEQFYHDFRKVVLYYSMPDALRDSHASEYKRPHNRTYYVCLWKPPEHNKVCIGKQLRFFMSAETFNKNQALWNVATI